MDKAEVVGSSGFTAAEAEALGKKESQFLISIVTLSLVTCPRT
jgi:hypothetical protein